MDLGDEKSEENAKYSFLLGAALRNDDPDQFLNIYDDILPKDIRPEEVERVKGTARRIASLPEDQFNELVAQARDFSLVFSPRTSNVMDPSEALRSLAGGTSHVSTATSVSSVSSDIKYMELDDMRKPDRAPVDDDCDSGVCNSSKNTCSLSDDNDLTDDSERAGVIDYFYSSSDKPSKTVVTVTSTEKVHITQQHSAAYDDSFEADSPLESSPHEPHSPKSEEDSDYLARKEFMECHSNVHAHRETHSYRDEQYCQEIREQNEALRRKNDMIYDEVHHTVHSDDDLTEIKVEDMGRGSKAHHLRKETPLHFPSFSRQQGVDKTVTFPLSTRPTRVSSSTHTVPSSRMSPFHTETSHNAVASRARTQDEALLDFPGRSTASSASKDNSSQAMSLFETTGNSSDEAQSDKKKKKKTKKITKKEEAAKDINGNPVREDSPPASSSSSSASSSSAVGNIRQTGYPQMFTTNFPDQLNQFGTDLTSGIKATTTGSHDMSSSDSLTNKSARKKKKKDKEHPEIKAENIPGHKGHMDVHDLLKFITGRPENKENDKTINSKNKKKKPQKNGPSITGAKDETRSVCNNRAEGKVGGASTTGVGKILLRENDSLSGISFKLSSVEAENQLIVLSSSVTVASSEADRTHSTESHINSLPDLAKVTSSKPVGSFCVTAPGTVTVVPDSGAGAEYTSPRSTSPDEVSSQGDTMSVLINNPPVPATSHTLVDTELLPLLSDAGSAKNRRKKLQKNGPASGKEEGKSSGNGRVAISGYGSLDGDRRSSSGSEKNTSVISSSAASDSGQSEDVLVNKDLSDSSAPASQDGTQEEAEASSPLLTESAAKLSPSRSPDGSSGPSADTPLVGGNDKYIFTDFEVVPPPSEGEFTVVSTRRKKKRNPPVQTQRQTDRLRPQAYGRPPINITNITPILAAPAPVPRDTSSERAFSPSGFPMLGRGQEGRRNSTGTVPCVPSTCLQDESDTESVKSLPAAGNPVPAKKDSYAKIVAGSKSDHPSTADKKSAGGDPAWGDVHQAECEMTIDMDEYPPMCGNTRPEDVHISPPPPQRDCPLTTPAAQQTAGGTPEQDKCAGEEVSVTCQMSVSIPVNTAEKSNIMPAVATLDKQEDVAKTTSPSVSSRQEAAPVEDNVNRSHKPPSRPSSAKQAPISSVSHVNIKPSSELSAAKLAGASSGEAVDTKPVTGNPGNPRDAAAAKPPSSASQKQPTKTKSAKVRQQSKSVIFLDRHFQEPGPALGITFGFEPGLEEDNATISQQASSEQEEAIMDVPLPAQPAPSQHEPSPDPPIIITSQSSTQHPCTDSSATATTTTTNSHSNPKMPAFLPNGIVIPCSGAACPVPSKPATPAFSPLASRLHSPPPRELDANFQPGFFNQQDCVGYVYTNWEDVQNRQKKAPHRVVLFCVE